ncbi:MAG: hypothetical protein ABSH20_06010 [Tepidisphaeraceae bacterium]|jgi:hypothetical protein
MRLRQWLLGSLVAVVAAVAVAADFKAGDDVQVEKGTKWMKAKIVEARPGQYLVHYDGLDAAFDEMVPAARVRAAAADFKAGDSVEIQKGTKWMKGQVLDVKPGQCQVHYDGLDAAFDEWVPVARVRSAGPRPAVGPNATAGQDADVKLTEPVWAGAVVVSMGSAGMPWGYVPAKAAAVPAPLAGAASIRLTGGTGQFFEKCSLGGFAGGKSPVALVCYKDAPPGKPVTLQAQLVDLAAGRTLVDWVPLPETEALAVSPDGKYILCRSDKFRIGTKGRLDLWTVDAGKARQVMSWRPSTETEWAKVDVKTAEFIDGTHVLTLCADSKLVLWEVPTARAVWQMQAGILVNPVFSDDRSVLIVEADNRLGIIETSTGKCLGVLPSEIAATSHLAIAPDGKRLAVCGNSAFALWDLEKPAPLIEVGQSVALGDVRWLADDMLLADGKYLIDPKLGIVVWRVAPGGGEIRLSGGRAWRVDTAQGRQQKKQYTLVGGSLPLDAARKAAARIKPETAYLLTPGAKVSLDFNQPVVNGDLKNQAMESVRSQLKDAGVGVADGQAIQIIATKTPGENKTVEYRMFGGGRQPVNYTVQQYAVKVMAADMVAWQATSVSGAPPMVMLNQGETAQDHVNKNMGKADQFFLRVKIPKLIAQPSRNPGFGESPL